MNIYRFVLSILLVGAVCALGAAQDNWVLRWTKLLTDPNELVLGTITRFDSSGNVYLVITESEEIYVNKYDSYGSLLKTLSLPGKSPTGFALDSLGDMFLQYDQVQGTSLPTETLAGWNSSGTLLFSKPIPPVGSDSQFGLGLGTDASNNVYLATQATDSSDQYMKFSRTGVQEFLVDVPISESSVVIDSTGRCSILGFDLNSKNLPIGAHAVVLSPTNGDVLFEKDLADTANSTYTYSFGGGNFDPAGNLYLNTITVSGGTVLSSVECYNTSFSKVWEVGGIKGYAWHGEAESPGSAYAWGTLFNGVGQGSFVASVSGGKLNWNKSTGYAIDGIWGDALGIELLDNLSSNQVMFYSFDPDDGNDDLFGQEAAGIGLLAGGGPGALGISPTMRVPR